MHSTLPPLRDASYARLSHRTERRDWADGRIVYSERAAAVGLFAISLPLIAGPAAGLFVIDALFSLPFGVRWPFHVLLCPPLIVGLRG
jgi:hypothetical protein